MINSNGANVKTYVGSDGKIHFTDWTGADSVLNFSKGVIGSLSNIVPLYQSVAISVEPEDGSAKRSISYEYTATNHEYIMAYCKVRSEYNSKEYISIYINDIEYYYIEKTKSDRGQYWHNCLELQSGDVLKINLYAGISGGTIESNYCFCAIFKADLL